MSIISRIKVWGSEILKSSDLNGEFNNIINFINNVDSGTTVWDNVKVTTLSPVTNNVAMGGLKMTGLAAGTIAGDSVRYEQLFSGSYWGYRRPVLQYSSGTVVNMEAGLTGTSGQVAILFPDGTYRTDSTAGRINCNLAQNASLTGTAQSGLRTGSQTANTWYAFYAVKSQVNTTDIVHVADTVLPIQANFATLNSNFGTNSWVYLGLARNGDNSGATTAILKFVQAGNYTIFTNSASEANTFTQRGLLLTNSASSSGLIYSYSAGTGTAQIPSHITIAKYSAAISPSGGSIFGIFNSAGTIQYAQYYSNGQKVMTQMDCNAADGLQSTQTGAAGNAIFLCGFVDGVLGVGSNPIM